VNSLPKAVTRQRRDCDLNPGLSAPEYSTLTTRLSSHPGWEERLLNDLFYVEWNVKPCSIHLLAHTAR